MPAAELLYALTDTHLATEVDKHLRGAGLELASDLQPEPESFLGDPFPTRCVALIWTANVTRWPEVVGKANEAAAEGKLVILNFVYNDRAPFLVFPGAQSFDLSEKGPKRVREFARLVQTIRAMVNVGEEGDEGIPRSDQQLAPTAVSAGAAAGKRLCGGVFLCYRTDDALDLSGRLYDRLALAYGADRVFRDTDSMPAGVEYKQHILEQVSRSCVLIVVIGPHWLSIKDEDGSRKLEEPRDILRAEIATALKREIPIIPVFVHGATMPQEEELPEDIRSLVGWQGIDLHHKHWREGVERLIKELDRIMGRTEQN